MRVEKADTDYYIYLTIEDARLISTNQSKPGGFQYPFVAKKVIGQEGKGLDETLGITSSRYARIANARDQLTFQRGEDEEFPQDINVRVFTPRILDLIEGRIPHIVTRYNSDDKVWIFIEEE